MSEFSISRKVYFDDTDGGGVVYHANYLRYMDHARSAFLEDKGFELNELLHTDKILFAVAEASVKYRHSARLSDQLYITANLLRIAKVSMIFEQCIYRQNKDDSGQILLAEGIIKLGCLGAVDFKPCPIPNALKERLDNVG